MSEDKFVLLDLRGLVLHSLYSGTDPDEEVIDGSRIRKPGYALDKFVENYLLPIAENTRLNRIIACLDGGNSYRQARLPQYKAHRKEVHPSVQQAHNKAQAAIIDLLNALGIPQAVVPGVEADDLIAYFCQKLPGIKIIHTVDNDLLQLASDCVHLYVRGERNLTGYKKDQTVIPFKQVALFKSLCGDSSDGYKGINRFGLAKWNLLVEGYGQDGLSEIQEAINADNLAPLRAAIEQEPGQHPLLELLLQNRADWKVCWDLACLHPELVEAKTSSGFARIAWTKRLPNKDSLKAVLTTNDCQYLLTELDVFMPIKLLVTADTWEGPESYLEIKHAFEDSPFVALDWETTAPVHEPFNTAKSSGSDYVDMLSSTITGAGFTFGRNLEFTLYTSYEHKDTNNLDKTVLVNLIDAIPPALPKVVHNAYFERTVYKSEFNRELSNCWDTKVMFSHIAENDPAGLKSLSKQWLNHDQLHYEEVIEKEKSMQDYSAQHVFSYGADDPFVTAHLFDLFYIIQRLEGTWEFTRDNEFPSIYELSDAYIAGVSIDWEEMRKQEREDTEAFHKNISRLRELLETKQTPELRNQGANILYDETATVLKAKAQKEGWTEEKLKDALDELRTSCQEQAEYKPLVKKEKELSILPTKGQVEKAAAVLGLPPLTASSGKKIAEYLEACSEKVAGSNDLNLMAFVHALSAAKDCVGKVKLYQTEAAQTLGKRCAEIIRKSLPESERFVYEGTQLNIGSPPQMVQLLHGLLALPIRTRNFEVTGKRKEFGLLEGGPQANEDAINIALAEDAREGDWRREALQCLLTARKADTRKKNFYSKYPLWEHPKDGLIHPQMNSTGTETRRPSGSNPNPLQWPKKGEGVKFRRCILPNTKHKHDLVCSIDWNAEEVRILAGLSQDKALLSCYPETGKGKDVHSMTGCKIAGMSYDEFYSIVKDDSHPRHKEFVDKRAYAKQTVFGGIYEVGPAKLARKIIRPIEEAREYLETNKAAHPGVEAWRERSIRELHSKGYAETLFGSRRHFYERLFVGDPGLRKHYERAANNFRIQGCAADILKRTLAELRRRKTFFRHKAQLVAAIYDELVFTCCRDQAVSLIIEVHEVMTRPVPGLGVYMQAEPSLGLNFGDQFEIGAHPTEELILAAIEKADQQTSISMNKARAA